MVPKVLLTHMDQVLMIGLLLNLQPLRPTFLVFLVKTTLSIPKSLNLVSLVMAKLMEVGRVQTVFMAIN